MARKGSDASQALLFGDSVPVVYNDLVYPAARVMLASGDENWCTDPETLEIVYQFDAIGLDPFSNAHSLVQSRRRIMLPDNSLLADWPVEELVWCNPPYGDALTACAQKIGAHAQQGGEVLTLVPARVDTQWWQDFLRPPIWLAFRRRLRFLEPIEVLKARHADRVEKALKAGQRPPPEPRYKMVSDVLARGETATFASALCYHGRREQRFREVFGRCGRIYKELYEEKKAA